MKKNFVLRSLLAIMLLFVGLNTAWADGKETFSGITTNSSSYGSVSFTGEDGSTWNATDSRTDQTIEGKAITLRRGCLESGTLEGGISKLSFSWKRAFSESSTWSVDIYVNNTKVGTFNESVGNTNTVYTYELELETPIEGEFTLKLNQTTNKRLTIDNLSWVGYVSSGEGGGEEVIVAQPTFNPAAGAVTKGTEVELSCETVDATIYYALGESEEYEEYSEAITINAATTIKAYAKLGDVQSTTVVADYTIAKLADPTFTPEGGMVAAGTEVTISAAAGATVMYSIDGGDTYNKYTAAIVVNEETTITAYATQDGYDDSNKVTETYTMLPEGLSLGTIVFKTTSSDSSTAATTANFVSGQVESTDFEGLSCTATNNCYTGKSGLKMSSGSTNGSFSLDLGKTLNVTQIVVNAVRYGSDAAAMSVNGSGSQSLTATVADYTFDINKEISTIKVDMTKRGYIASITVNYVTATTPPDPVDVAEPTFTPGDGTAFDESLEVTINVEDGLTAYYSYEKDGEYAEYSTINITETTTVYAYAQDTEGNKSDIVSATYTKNVPVDPNATTGTIDFSTPDQRVSLGEEKQVWSNDGITFTNNKASSTADVADYTNPVRLYKSSEIVIECANIAKIVFVCSSESYATALKNSIGDAASVSDKEVTVTLNGTSNSFSAILRSAQVRLNSLTVTYVPYPENIVCEQNYYLDVEGGWTIAEGNSLAAYFMNKNTGATTWSVGEYLADTKHYVFYLSQYNVPAAAPARAKAEEAPVYTHVKFVNFEGATDALTPWVDGTRVNETAELTYTPAEGYEYTIYSVAGGGAWVGKNDDISTGLEAVESDGMVYAGNVVAAEGAIEVYNLSGAVVARGNNRVDLNGLAGGVYVVRCGNDVLKVVR